MVTHPAVKNHWHYDCMYARKNAENRDNRKKYFLKARKATEKKRQHHHDQGNIKHSIVIPCVIKVPLKAKEDKMKDTHSKRNEA